VDYDKVLINFAPAGRHCCFVRWGNGFLIASIKLITIMVLHIFGVVLSLKVDRIMIKLDLDTDNTQAHSRSRNL